MMHHLHRIRMLTAACCLLVLTGALPRPCAGQAEEGLQSDTSRLKLYLDCWDCDFAYFRRHLPFVDFVRDQNLGDLHLMVTEQHTASGGRSYRFNFMGQGEYADLNYTLEAITFQSDTELQTWNKLLHTTRMGLMPYVSRTNELNNLNILYASDSAAKPERRESTDPWDYWVFRLRFGTDIELEESQNEYSLNGSFSIDRITELLKFRGDIMIDRTVQTFIDNDTVIQGLRHFMDSDLEWVYSLGPRWSVGIFNEIRSSSFENIDFSDRFGPAIEYNIFPWDESDRKIFSFGYHIQAHYFDYREMTIYNRMEEARMSQSLRLSLVLRQPWGEVETRLEGLHYFHDFNRNRLTLDSRLSVNITKGLSVFAELDAALIHDQLSLPAGEVTREELLLRQQQLETSYDISAEFGISVTFGSIYNNIVNQRL